MLPENTNPKLEEPAVGNDDAAVKNEREERNKKVIQNSREGTKPIGLMMKNDVSRVAPEAKRTKDHQF